MNLPTTPRIDTTFGALRGITTERGNDLHLTYTFEPDLHKVADWLHNLEGYIALQVVIANLEAKGYTIIPPAAE